jgi:hypothetical protein
MGPSKRNSRTSGHTANLLREGESQRGDFKRAPEGISADDLVAFANSEVGGTILAGVDEGPGPGGTQIGLIVGCDVSDATVLQITNKALSCLPPVAIEVYIENLGKAPILRVDIPSSPTKPHCTPKGVYCRRDGSRNRPLHPSELLKIFLDSESRAFAERFESAADRITANLTELEETLDASIKSMGNQLGWAELKLGDTESTLDSILAYTQRINAESNDLTSRLRAMFRQDKRQDPVYDRERKKLLDEMVNQLWNDKKLQKNIKAGGSITISAKGRAAEELTKDDLDPIFREAIKIVGDRLEQKKYSIKVKTPAECDEGELHASAKLIAEGGEVADGVEQRLRTAEALGLVHYEKEVVGVAALKKPTPNYRKSVFEKAMASLAPSDFPWELGWIFLKQEHRSKGQMRPLLETLLNAAGTTGVFATTRTSNHKMQRILAHQKFVRHGDSYQSAQRPDEQILLFVRPASSAERKVEPRHQNSQNPHR